MNEVNEFSESVSGKHFIPDIPASSPQQQRAKLCTPTKHPHVWYPIDTVPLLPLTTVLNSDVKRFTSKHNEMTMLTQDDDSMNLVVFDNTNLSVIMIVEEVRKTVVSKRISAYDYI